MMSMPSCHNTGVIFPSPSFAAQRTRLPGVRDPVDPSSRIKCSKVFKNGHGSARLYRWVALPLPPSSGRSVPTDISHAADSRLSRTRVHSSPPSFRVWTAAGPDLTLDIVAKSWLSGAADGPSSPVPGSGLLRSPTLVLYRDKICFVCLESGARPLSSLLIVLRPKGVLGK